MGECHFRSKTIPTALHRSFSLSRHGRRRPTIHEFLFRGLCKALKNNKKHGWSAFADHDEKRGAGRREKLGNPVSRTVAIVGNRQPASCPDADRNLNRTPVDQVRDDECAMGPGLWVRWDHTEVVQNAR
jgi:hypothetical protein